MHFKFFGLHASQYETAGIILMIMIEVYDSSYIMHALREEHPRVQFANIRKMVLCQGLPHCLRLCVMCEDPCHAWHVMPKVSTHVCMLDRKIWKLFRPRGNGQKGTKCDQFFCPTSDFFDFCNPRHVTFIIPLGFKWCGFFWQSLCRNMWPQFVYIAVSLDWKINIWEYWGPM